jgi:hypothetical protein
MKIAVAIVGILLVSGFAQAYDPSSEALVETLKDARLDFMEKTGDNFNLAEAKIQLNKSKSPLDPWVFAVRLVFTSLDGSKNCILQIETTRTEMQGIPAPGQEGHSVSEDWNVDVKAKSSQCPN